MRLLAFFTFSIFEKEKKLQKYLVGFLFAFLIGAIIAQAIPDSIKKARLIEDIRKNKGFISFIEIKGIKNLEEKTLQELKILENEYSKAKRENEKEEKKKLIKTAQKIAEKTYIKSISKDGWLRKYSISFDPNSKILKLELHSDNKFFFTSTKMCEKIAGRQAKNCKNITGFKMCSVKLKSTIDPSIYCYD